MNTAGEVVEMYISRIKTLEKVCEDLTAALANMTAERDALQHELGRKDSDLLSANFRFYELQLDWQRMIQALDNLPGDMREQAWTEYGRLKNEPEATE